MIFFFTLTFFFIFLVTVYVFNPVKEKKKFLAIFFFISFSTFMLYKELGNINSFFFHSQLEQEIQNLINDPENFSKIEPQKIIFFLEKKLQNNPNDRDGWILLARTCLITGHNQKADLYYKKSLKYFPNDEKILYEYSVLKKNTSQFESALKILFQIKKINPLNLDSRKLILQILKQTNQLKKLDEEIIQLQNTQKINNNWLKKTILELH